MKPFLLRFARPSCSPRRAEPSDDYFYDEESAIVRWRGAEGNPPAVEAPKVAGGPRTKKADMEKGEDVKDGRMW